MNEHSTAGCRALAISTCLNHIYCIEGVLGEGGFGITYIGRNMHTDCHVAIKEYFPAKLALRTGQPGDNTIYPFPGKEEELFFQGRQHFFHEATALKEFRHMESVVTVYDVFEENNTAYIVMEYIEGPTLEQYIREYGPMHFTELMPLITPIMQALSIIHEKKLIHRDISPDNLILGTDNRLHLIDFGAAGVADISRHPNTVILKSGYAPPEQYLSNSKIGAWIDVYALCATMYFALIGQPPSDAICRMDVNPPAPLASLTDILPWQREALEKGLDLSAARRFNNINELYCALTVAPQQKKAITVMEPTLGKKEKQQLRHIRIRRLIPHLVFIGSALFMLSCAILTLYAANAFPSRREHKSSSPIASSSTADTRLSHTPGTRSSITAETIPPLDSSPLLSMPDVSGIPWKQAKKIIKKTDSSIRVKTVHRYHENIKKGRVISQSVAKNTFFSKGQLRSVRITISLGKKPDTSSHAFPGRTKTPATKVPQKTLSPGYQIVPEDNDYDEIMLE